jgi:capsular polysaccharide biosynthesis protein
MDRLRARWLLALALIIAGLIVGVAGAYAYSRTEPKLYRAQTALIAQSGSQPVTGGTLSTISKLVTTDIVAQNVIRNQGLSETSTQFYKRLHASTTGSVITVDVDDASQAEAVKLAQELSLVFTQLVRDRFGSGASAAGVTIFDPAHAVGQISPRVSRDVGWGALFGALLGLLVANVFVLRGRRGVWMPVPHPFAPLPELGVGERRLGDRRVGERRALPSPQPPPSLGDDAEEIADSLLAHASQEPFQTVLVAGDPDGTLTAGIAHALAERGERTMWIHAADASEKELDVLTARCAYVLVASPSFDPELAQTFDAVVAVTDANAPEPRSGGGIRVVGTIER